MKLNHEKYLGDKLAYKISMKQDDLGFHDKGLKKIHVKWCLVQFNKWKEAVYAGDGWNGGGGKSRQSTVVLIVLVLLFNCIKDREETHY